MRKYFSHKISALLLSLTAAALPLKAQAPDSSKVRLISAQSAQLLEKDGQNYRKVVGPAKFFHNKTYLLCDTALWNVSTNIIDAVGHVSIIQDQTRLTSETLQYVVDEDMAKFRGSLVQLEDKENNTLRTRYLDYNTKDSVAIFQNGAAMRDKDGQVIESLYGTYDSKAHLFVFNDQVNMYMDTTFVKTSRLEYRSDLSTAYFGYATDMWQDDKMLSANDGWYDRSRELFMFRENVHLLTENQETWSDSLYYHRAAGDVEMLGHVELMDTTRNVYALAGRFEYADSLKQLRMTREPAIMSIDEKNEKRDTLYIGADVLLYRSIKKCDIPADWTKTAEKRLADISGDPVMEYRRKAAEEARKAAEEAAKNDPNRPPEPKADAKADAKKPGGPRADVPAPADTLTKNPADTTVKAPADTTPAAPDTSKIAFLWGSKRVRLFRRDLQMAGDSLTYTDLDSLVRLYQDPIFYNEGNRQYAADSIYMVIKGKQLQKAHLLSNAFITIQEDPHSYDQIRGAEMVAYFDSTSALTRFDALGGAASLFYLEEKDALATVNKVETKMIYATFKDGEIERMYYYDNPKNDGYPTVQLPQDDKQLKGFRWEPERRPASPLDVTTLVPRPSERTSYLARPHTEFRQTNDYFPGYIRKVYRDIAIRDSLAVVRQREEQRRKEMEAVLAPKDTVAQASPDSLAISDSTAVAPALPDSLATAPAALPDSLAATPATVPADSLVQEKPLTRAQQKALEREKKKAERERIQAEKQAAREAKWAEEDRIYQEKQAAKKQKKLEKERARKLKALRKLERKAQKERALFEKYLQRERERAQKKNKTKQ
ncbi:MAG TPA: hypothetical protein DCF48_02195 [Rikenellaceae bacterium]|nr:hypothetical protein [Rikenellaceae bacterium]